MVILTLYENFAETLNITSKDTDLTFEQLGNKILQKDTWKKQFGSNGGN